MNSGLAPVNCSRRANRDADVTLGADAVDCPPVPGTPQLPSGILISPPGSAAYVASLQTRSLALKLGVLDRVQGGGQGRVWKSMCIPYSTDPKPLLCGMAQQPVTQVRAKRLLCGTGLWEILGGHQNIGSKQASADVPPRCLLSQEMGRGMTATLPEHAD